jgi:hypothetical protein
MKRALVLSLLLVACKKSSPAPQVSATDARASDGNSAEPEEADVRAGKRTGLGAPDEKPEVATEDLARGLLRGTVSWPRVIDPRLGVLELTTRVEQRCGDALEAAIVAFREGATAALDDPALVYDVQCDNVGLSVTIPGVTSHAVCSIASPSGSGMEFDMVFVPDTALGLRLIGLSAADAVAADDALRDQFDEALGRLGARCP